MSRRTGGQGIVSGGVSGSERLCREPGAAMNLSGDGGGGRGVAAAAVCRKRSNLDDPVHVRLSRGEKWGAISFKLRACEFNGVSKKKPGWPP